MIRGEKKAQDSLELSFEGIAISASVALGLESRMEISFRGSFVDGRLWWTLQEPSGSRFSWSLQLCVLHHMFLLPMSF